MKESEEEPHIITCQEKLWRRSLTTSHVRRNSGEGPSHHHMSGETLEKVPHIITCQEKLWRRSLTSSHVRRFSGEGPSRAAAPESVSFMSGHRF